MGKEKKGGEKGERGKEKSSLIVYAQRRDPSKFLKAVKKRGKKREKRRRRKGKKGRHYAFTGLQNLLDGAALVVIGRGRGERGGEVDHPWLLLSTFIGLTIRGLPENREKRKRGKEDWKKLSSAALRAERRSEGASRD